MKHLKKVAALLILALAGLNFATANDSRVSVLPDIDIEAPSKPKP